MRPTRRPDPAVYFELKRLRVEVFVLNGTNIELSYRKGYLYSCRIVFVPVLLSILMIHSLCRNHVFIVTYLGLIYFTDFLPPY